MTDQQLNDSSESELGYGQLLAIFVRRKFWIIGVFLIIFPIMAFMAMRKESTYQSSFRMLVESNVQTGGSKNTTSITESGVQIDYATQLNLMKSSQLLLKAVRAIRARYPDINVGQLRNSLELGFVADDKTPTKIFQAAYSNNDPIKTQKVLEEVQKVYENFNTEQQEIRLNEGLDFIDRQIKTARQGLAQAEASLEKFRKKENISDPAAQASALKNALNGIENERRSIQTQYDESLATYNSLQRQLDRSSKDALIATRLSQSPRYQTWIKELQQTDLALAQQRLRYTSTHPIVQALEGQRQEQVNLLKQEFQKIIGADANLDDLGERLLKDGQLGSSDLNFATQIVESQSKLASMRARDQSLAKTEGDLRTELNRFPTLLAEYERLIPDIQIKRDTLQTLMKARQELALEIARGAFKWQVVEPPRPGAKVGPDRKKDLLVAVVVSLFLGSVVGFLREALDDAVHTSEQLRKRTALPLLGEIPELPQIEQQESVANLPFRKSEPEILASTATGYWLPFRESLDLAYKNIQLLNCEVPISSLVITSTRQGEGKSTVALGLALSAARLHQKVLLIDADLRRPSLHRQLNLSNEKGFTNLLAGDTNVLSPHSVSLSGAKIHILTSGPTPSDPVSLLSSQRMQDLIAFAEQSYDLVLLDVPPILGIVDTIQIASFCTNVLMVGKINLVTQSEISNAMELLRKLNVVGVLANGVKSSSLISYKSDSSDLEERKSQFLQLYQPLTSIKEPTTANW